MRIKNIILIALVVAFILLLIWLAMQISGEGAWTAFDFTVAAVLLFGTGLVYELVARQADGILYRAAVGLALAAALLLVWINLAVGILGSEDNPFNWMYIGVLAVLILGAIGARFRPQAMERVLLTTALAHAFVTIIALIAGDYPDEFKILILNGVFVALWVGSALLFRRAHAAPERLHE